MTEERTWRAVSLGVGAATAVLVRRVATIGWRAGRHEDPPVHPSTRGVELRDALIWTIALGVGAAVARVLAERAAAAGWESVTGSPPPSLDD